MTLEALPAASLEDLALAASGSGLALELERRSLLVLHGSCVAIDGQGVCLLGSSGAGKSTLAAALQARGHELVSDAMTALRLGEGAARALPGWKVLKLWPAAMRRLGLEASRRRAVHRESEKQVCATDGPFADVPVPVRWFVVVLPAGPLALSGLTPAEGLMALVRNAYLVDDTPPSEQPQLLTRSGQALRHAAVAVLQRGAELSQLDDVAARVESWVRSAPSPRAAPG